MTNVFKACECDHGRGQQEDLQLPGEIGRDEVNAAADRGSDGSEQEYDFDEPEPKRDHRPCVHVFAFRIQQIHNSHHDTLASADSTKGVPSRFQ